MSSDPPRASPFLRTHGALVAAAARDHGIAIVSAEDGATQRQEALVSIAAQPEELGRLAAGQALQILRDGVAPGDLPVLRARDFTTRVNMDLAARLNRLPPDDMALAGIGGR